METITPFNPTFFFYFPVADKRLPTYPLNETHRFRLTLTGITPRQTFQIPCRDPNEAAFCLAIHSWNTSGLFSSSPIILITLDRDATFCCSRCFIERCSAHSTTLPHSSSGICQHVPQRRWTASLRSSTKLFAGAKRCRCHLFWQEWPSGKPPSGQSRSIDSPTHFTCAQSWFRALEHSNRR